MTCQILLALTLLMVATISISSLQRSKSEMGRVFWATVVSIFGVTGGTLLLLHLF